MTKTDWEHYERYDKIRKSAEHILRLTNTAAAPGWWWTARTPITAA